MSQTAIEGFVLEEYKSCRQQILEDIKWMDQLEIYCFGAVAAVYVFVFTQTQPVLIRVLMLIPLAIAMAGAMRTLALDKTIGILNDYLEQIEKKHPEIGFTTYYRANRSAVMKASRYMVWGFLPIVTLVFGLVVWICGPFWLKGAAPCP
jgi:hypothetical protein